MKEKITYVNSYGDTLDIEKYPFLLQDLDKDFAPVTILEDSSFNQDGANFYGTLVQPRNIAFDVVVKGTNSSDLIDKCELLLKVFNPKRGPGILIYDNGIKRRRIAAIVSYGPKKADMISNPTRLKYSIGLYCPSATWESVEQQALKMVGFIGGMELPVELPCILATQGDQVEINYEGTMEAPLLIEFRGPATSPKIVKKETNEFIEVNLELLEYETLFVETNQGKIKAYKYDEEGNTLSAFNYLNPLNSYFQLSEGINTISFEATAGTPEVFLYYRTQYIGVV